MLQVLVEKADQNYWIDKGAENRIKYRRKIAESFLHMGYLSDAQLYLVSAIHLARNHSTDVAKQEIQELHDFLHVIVTFSNEMSFICQKVRIAKNFERAVTYQYQHHNWLTLQSIRSQSRIIQYCTAQEENGRAAESSLITVVSTTRGPFGAPWWILNIVDTSVRSTIDGMEFVRLTSILDEAHELFRQDKFTDFVTMLASNYGHVYSPKRMFAFDKHTRLVIDSEKIIATLLGHGLRPDVIAYFLNLLAEALISNKIEFDPCNTQNSCTYLRALAAGIFRVVIDSASLHEAADRLDDHIFVNTTAANEGGSPEPFCPSWVCLEEVQNNARMNSAILEVFVGEKENLRSAAQLLLRIQMSPNSRTHQSQLRTISDLMSAFDIDVPDTANPAGSAGQVDPIFVDTNPLWSGGDADGAVFPTPLVANKSTEKEQLSGAMLYIFDPLFRLCADTNNAFYIRWH